MSATKESLADMTFLDIAFVGGSVFDGSGAAPTRTDVGVVGEKIVAVGVGEVAALIGEQTRVVDLEGKMLLPGIIDAHVHPIEAGLERLGCDLSELWTRAEYLQAIREYVVRHPDTEWILGGGWQMAAFADGFPLATDLDAICDDRPMAISNRDHHSTWVNTEAMRRAGITRDTPDPADGTIERDEHGNPTGTLHEGARMLVLGLAPDPSREFMYEALMSAQSYLHAFGITAWQDALLGDYGNHSSEEVYVYREALERGDLKARVNGAIWWDRTRGEDQIPELENVISDFQEGDFKLTTVKIMQDGVVENRTAAMSAPYMKGGCSCGDEADTGISFIERESLHRIATHFDKTGIQLHFHAIGDRGVTECIDAVAAARDANGDTGKAHQIAHLQVVHPNDLPRFAEHRVAANMQPLWASYDPQMVELNLPLIGEDRVNWQYPFKSILAQGGQLVAGSDWPVTTADPWLCMHVAVNRQHPQQHPDYNERVFVPGERLTLGEVLRAYTRGGAEINGWREDLGEIAPGFTADLVVIDRNPFDAPVGEISQTRTVETFSRGRSVYRADS